MEVRQDGRFFNQGSIENFSARSAEIFFIRVWLKNKNQGSIDLEMIFKRDRDRDENFSSRV
jgi:hypothetical protein